jgi:hypothetical protein
MFPSPWTKTVRTQEPISFRGESSLQWHDSFLPCCLWTYIYLFHQSIRDAHRLTEDLPWRVQFTFEFSPQFNSFFSGTQRSESFWAPLFFPCHPNQIQTSTSMLLFPVFSLFTPMHLNDVDLYLVFFSIQLEPLPPLVFITHVGNGIQDLMHVRQLLPLSYILSPSASSWQWGWISFYLCQPLHP